MFELFSLYHFAFLLPQPNGTVEQLSSVLADEMLERIKAMASRGQGVVVVVVVVKLYYILASREEGIVALLHFPRISRPLFQTELNLRFFCFINFPID